MSHLQERLQTFFPFDSDITELVQRAAHDQKDLSFRELADSFGIGGGPQTSKILGSRIEYLHIQAPNTDPADARVYYAPMALPADDNMAIRGMRLFAADPSRSLYIFGNAGPVGSRANIPGPLASLAAARGDFGRTVSPSLLRLHKDGVKRVETVGVSYGAELAAAAARVLVKQCKEIRPERSVLIEAVSPGRNSIRQLGKDFGASGARLDEYVEAALDVPLREARHMDDSALKQGIGFAKYLGGLLRLSNMANVSGMTHSRFGADLTTCFTGSTHDFRATIIRGSSSELAQEEPYKELEQNLTSRYGRRARFIEMQGMHHAGADDINLHAAMVLQGLRLARPQ